MSTVTASRKLWPPAPAVTSATPPSTENLEHRRRTALTALLERPRYEVLPLAGAAEQVQEHVPATLPVTVTSSPRRGLEPTLELAEVLARLGFSAVPHLAARLVRDDQHLADVLGRLDEVGIRDIFVVAGDGDPPVGGFADSLHLLRAIERLCADDTGRDLMSVGVAGYPEGHPLVADAELDRALLAKQAASRYVVTQMCFDGGTVQRWVEHARRLGLRQPVYAGVAGAVDRLRLLRVAGRIGVGSSLRYLRKQQDGATLLRRGGYRADALLGQLATHVPRGETGVDGLHVYTFGDVASTERWRRGLLDRLAEDAGHG